MLILPEKYMAQKHACFKMRNHSESVAFTVTNKIGSCTTGN